METNQTSKLMNYIIAIGFAVGASFGMAGSMVTDHITQMMFYEISSVGLIVAAVLISGKYAKENSEFVAAGFILFAIAEAVMTAGTASNTTSGSQPSFGAGMALYVPSLLLISIQRTFATFIRATGILTSIPFAIASAKIFMGGEVPETSILPSIGYTLLTITIVGWIWTILRKQKSLYQ